MIAGIRWMGILPAGRIRGSIRVNGTEALERISPWNAEQEAAP